MQRKAHTVRTATHAVRTAARGRHLLPLDANECLIHQIIEIVLKSLRPVAGHTSGAGHRFRNFPECGISGND